MAEQRHRSKPAPTPHIYSTYNGECRAESRGVKASGAMRADNIKTYKEYVKLLEAAEAPTDEDTRYTSAKRRLARHLLY